MGKFLAAHVAGTGNRTYVLCETREGGACRFQESGVAQDMSGAGGDEGIRIFAGGGSQSITRLPWAIRGKPICWIRNGSRFG